MIISVFADFYGAKRAFGMRKTGLLQVFLLMLCVLLAGAGASAQAPAEDGIPVLIKHLPDWENVRAQTTFATRSGDLVTALGERPVFDLIDFSIGTEAVTAPYPAGKLLIVEYATPQASVEADGKFVQRLAENDNGRSTVYRRIGNYNVFVFDATDQAAAEALLEQVKYEKTVQWLGEDPFLLRKLERAFVLTSADIFVTTVEVILLGIGISIVGGLIVGFLYFRVLERRRRTFKEFSDAGGMIRLNLDGLTPDISHDLLLKQ